MLTLTANIQKGFNTNITPCWVVKMTLDDAVRYYASEYLTISSQPYVSYFVSGLSGIDQSIDITDGGSIGQVGTMTLTLNRLSKSAGLQADFLPFNTSGTQPINRKVEIGIIVKTAAAMATTDITWIFTGIIQDIEEVTTEAITMTLFPKGEDVQTDLPQVRVDIEDYPNAPKESIGEVIPIVYGDFISDATITRNREYGKYRMVPTICVDRIRPRFLIASHPLYSMDSNAAYYKTSGMKNYSFLYTVTVDDTLDTPATTTTPYDGFPDVTFDVSGTIVGEYFSLLSYNGYYMSDIDYPKAIDGDSSTSVAVPNAGFLSLLPDHLPSGEFSIAKRFGGCYAEITSAIAPFRFEYVTKIDSGGGVIVDSVVEIEDYPTGAGSTSIVSAGVDFLAAFSSPARINDTEFMIQCAGVGYGVTVKAFGIWFYHVVAHLVRGQAWD